MRLFTRAAALLVLIAGSRGAVAGLIVDGGFESASPGSGYTQTIPGWTLTNANTSFTGVTSNTLSGISAHGGSNWASLSNFQSNGLAILSQTLTTTIAGGNYDLSFYFAAGIGSGAGTEFDVVWDGTTLKHLTNYSASGWTRYDFTVTGTGNDTVQFEGFSTPSWNGLDDVSLTATTAVVPEPATFVVFGLAVPIGLFLSARQRRPPVPA